MFADVVARAVARRGRHRLPGTRSVSKSGYAMRVTVSTSIAYIFPPPSPRRRPGPIVPPSRLVLMTPRVAALLLYSQHLAGGEMDPGFRRDDELERWLNQPNPVTPAKAGVHRADTAACDHEPVCRSVVALVPMS